MQLPCENTPILTTTQLQLNLGLGNLLSEMSCRVQTGEDPVRVNQTNDEGHTIRLPSCSITEMTEDELCTSMGTSTGGNSHQDDEVADERDVESDFGDERQGLAKAVEEVTEEVDQLVSHNNMPRLDLTREEISGCRP